MIQKWDLFEGFANEIHKQAYSRYQIIVLERYCTFNSFIHRIRYFIQNNEKSDSRLWRPTVYTQVFKSRRLDPSCSNGFQPVDENDRISRVP